MRLCSFIAGAFGTVGFGLSLLAGISASNSLESILIRGMLSAGACYVVGYFVGWIAQQISQEHAQRVAKFVDNQDKKDEQAAVEAQAQREADALQAQSAISAPPGTS